MREFKETNLTTQILIALNYAILMLPNGDYQMCGDKRITGDDYRQLYNKIKNEKLDIRLVSREE